jgi:signal peptidase I
VFRLPRNPQQTWIKRVMGLPGDRVQVRDGAVFLNGRALSEQTVGLGQDHDDAARTVRQVSETQPSGRRYITYDAAPGREGDDTDVYLVPDGCYFVMGDNRDNSFDSRWPSEVGVGFLPAENILGKAEFVLVSWKPGSALSKPWTWLNLQHDRFFQRVR